MANSAALAPQDVAGLERGAAPPYATCIMTLWRVSAEGGWVPESLEGAAAVPLAGGVALVAACGDRCVLLARAGAAAVNGAAALPMVVLGDRDEVRAGRAVFYVSISAPARPRPFTPGPKPVRCPRCNDVLAAGRAVVVCPACNSPHHEECWGYARTCAHCPQPVSGPAWSPEV